MWWPCCHWGIEYGFPSNEANQASSYVHFELKGDRLHLLVSDIEGSDIELKRVLQEFSFMNDEHEFFLMDDIFAWDIEFQICSCPNQKCPIDWVLINIFPWTRLSTIQCGLGDIVGQWRIGAIFPWYSLRAIFQSLSMDASPWTVQHKHKHMTCVLCFPKLKAQTPIVWWVPSSIMNPSLVSVKTCRGEKHASKSQDPGKLALAVCTVGS